MLFEERVLPLELRHDECWRSGCGGFEDASRVEMTPSHVCMDL